MPVAGGPKITTTGILLEVDAANASSYTSGSSTWVNVFNPGTRNGTINGTLGFNQDDSKGALTFPGTASSYVDFGNIGDLSVSWSFQVAVKPAPSASGNYTILSYASGSNTGSWTYKLDYSSSNQSAVLSVYSATGSAQIVHQVTGSVPTGSWSIINASYGNTVVGMYVNGQPTGYVVTTGSTAGYNANNRLYLGGTYGLDSGFYTGSMASFFSYNTDVPNTQLVQNYNAYGTRFGLPPSVLFPGSSDPDAFRFIEIAGLTDQTQITAVNNLVTGLKANSLWDKMQVIYPFIGGTAFSHKWNLKNPLDTDDGFRIQYVGSVGHSSNGVTSTGGYIQTYFNPSDITPPSSSFHVSSYLYTEGTSGNGMVLGNARTTDILYLTQFSSTLTQYALLGSYAQFADTADERGYHVMTRTPSSTSAILYRYIVTGNFTEVNTGGFSSTSNGSIALLGNTGTSGIYNGIMNFATFGAGLTAGESTTLNTIVRNFNIALSRNVV